MATLQTVLDGIMAAAPMVHRNLTLVPLVGNGHGGLDYLLAAEAIEQGRLRISEVSEHGAVPELLAVTDAEICVLIIGGEQLVGAKQDRICNADILLPARASTKIPVSCVEYGRWYSAGATMKAASYAPPKLRSVQSRSAGRSLRATGRATADQHAVWDQVAANLESLQCEAPTGALRAATEHCGDDLEACLAAMPCPTGARGVAVGIGGEFVAVDLFDRPETLGKLWPRLVRAYALDALGEKESPQAGGFGPQQAGQILERLRAAQCNPLPSAGLGEDWRFEEKDVAGAGLVVDDVCVHLCAFPNDNPAHPATDAGFLARPSRRRRMRGRGR